MALAPVYKDPSFVSVTVELWNCSTRVDPLLAVLLDIELLSFCSPELSYLRTTGGSNYSGGK
jgi:hypothetical protein